MDEAVGNRAQPTGERTERASIEHVQRLIDRLAQHLGLPVSVDDERFRLQLYAPQLGTLDRVRIASILFRDSPNEAKDWVRSHHVAAARGPTRVPAAEELGLLSRVCTPVVHHDALLGYLWIIDAHEQLDDEALELTRQCAMEIGPGLFRRRFLDRLDRQAERAALIELFDPRPESRRRGAAALVSSMESTGTMARVLVVRPMEERTVTSALPQGVLTEGRERDAWFADGPVAQDLLLEVALEQARGLFPPSELRFFRRDGVALVLLMGGTAERAEAPRGAARMLHGELVGQLTEQRVVIGVGRMVEGLHEVYLSADDAQDAAELAVRDVQRPDIIGTRWLGPQRTLLALPDVVRERIVTDALGPLLQHRDAESLLETLAIYLRVGGDAAAVARSLALHRSSVYGRLHRIADILSADLTDGEVRMALHHAIVARAIGDPESH